MTINDILKNTSYEDVIFSEVEKAAVASAVIMKDLRGAKTPYIPCPVRNKEIKLTSEEVIRQLLLHRLIHQYRYPVGRIHVEEPVHFGREVKRADIVIFDKALGNS